MTPADDVAVTVAAHVLREKFDVLLDRLTDVVLESLTQETTQWRNVVHGPGDLTRIARGARRADVRALVAAHAGVADPAGAPQYSSAS